MEGALSDEEPRASSLPSSPTLSRRGSFDAPQTPAPRPAQLPLPRVRSCESGIFSVANEELCPQRAGAGCLYGAMCPCSLVGCHRCWWWRRDASDRSDDFDDTDPTSEHRVRMCSECLLAYDRALDAKAPRTKAILDDSALSATTISSLRSLDDSEETPPRIEDINRRPDFDQSSPFLCGKLDASRPDSDASDANEAADRLREYHILNRCCCVDRRCLDGCVSRLDDDDVTSLLQRGPLTHILTSGKRTSSVYTDSSEDVASLAGSDSLYSDDRIPRHVRSAQISKIVEYFERKGADFKCERTVKGHSRFKMSNCAKMETLQFGKCKDGDRDKEYYVDVKHRSGGRLTDLVEDGCGRKCLAQQRLMICEGAVKSKLPLFDKKS